MISIILISVLSICVYILGWAAWILIGVLNDWQCGLYRGIENKEERFKEILDDQSKTYILFGLLSWIGVLCWLILLIFSVLHGSSHYIVLCVGKLIFKSKTDE